jgi:hypothetical protein
MRMGHGFRSSLRLAATVAAAAAVMGAAATARRVLSQPAPDPPRHRAQRGDATRPTRPVKPVLTPTIVDIAVVASAIVVTEELGARPSAYHPFGPEPCRVPSRGIEIPRRAPLADVIELEASGELEDAPMRRYG